MQFIDLKKQYSLIEKNILDAIEGVLRHGQYIMGPEVAQLEKKLAAFLGVNHVIATASGTDALLMSLLALKIVPGDEVITSPFSFFATAQVIALMQAKPVFVDIDPETYNIDVKKIANAISSKTKAIMPVSLYGRPVDMNPINAIAKQYNLPVIEDAAQSFGATYHNAYSGTLATIGCTSFFPSKPLGSYGDAGACFTQDASLAERLREIRIHGQTARYSHAHLGINGRMDTIQAAILLEKFKLFPKEIKLRNKVAQRYDRLLSSFVKTPRVDVPGNNSIFAQYTIEVPHRAHFQKQMQALGIPTAIHYPQALHEQKALAYLGYKQGDFPQAEQASKRVISLPMHSYLSWDEQKRIAAAIKICLKHQIVDNHQIENKQPILDKHQIDEYQIDKHQMVDKQQIIDKHQIENKQPILEKQSMV